MTVKADKGGGARRLDAAAWVKAGLEVLAAQGIAGVRVEPLAKQLNVTKGSFYWHFKDREALLEAMLTAWRRRATLQVIERIESSREPAEERLRQLLSIGFRPRASHAAEIELSIQLWGRTDARAHAALAEVDELRLRYIASLIDALGVAPDVSRARAVLAYSYIRVASTLVDAADATLRADCEAVILRRD